MRPGYFLTGVDLEEFGADGKLRIGLQSISANEDPASGIVRLSDVAVDYHAPTGRLWHLTAEEARVPPGGRVVEFEGDVRLAGQPGEDARDAQLHTARNDARHRERIAETRSPVELAFGTHRMHALGMRADLKAGNTPPGIECQWPPRPVAAWPPPFSPPAPRQQARRSPNSSRSRSSHAGVPTSTTRMASSSSTASRSRRARSGSAPTAPSRTASTSRTATGSSAATVRISMPDSEHRERYGARALRRRRDRERGGDRQARDVRAAAARNSTRRAARTESTMT